MMIDRDKIIEQRKKEIQLLQKQQDKLLKAAGKLGKKPPCKRVVNGLNRLSKIVTLVCQAQGIEIQIRMIVAQPIPKKEFPKGGVGPNGPAIVGDNHKAEIIITPDGRSIKT